MKTSVAQLQKIAIHQTDDSNKIKDPAGEGAYAAESCKSVKGFMAKSQKMEEVEAKEEEEVSCRRSKLQKKK